MKTAPVSVIIPAYNAAPFLEAAINSVMRQTLPVAEIIVVDDGSTDETAQIARRFGVSVISQSNKGLSGARNTGIRAAQQKWIALLDADDLWEAEKIEKQMAAAEQYPKAHIICCDFSKFKGEQIVNLSFLSDPEFGYRDVPKELTVQNISLVNIDERFWGRSHFTFPSSMVIERELLLRVGAFDESLTHCEDVDCFLRVLRYTKLLVVEESLMRYRLHSSNHSSNTEKMIRSYIKIARKMIDEPNAYPPGAAGAFASPLAQKYEELGLIYLKEKHFADARECFRESLKMKQALRVGLFWFVTLLPTASVDVLLDVKHRLEGRANLEGDSSS